MQMKWEMQKANGKQNDKCEVVKSQLNDFDLFMTSYT